MARRDDLRTGELGDPRVVRNKPTVSIVASRNELMAAIYVLARAQGEAQWTQGYRCRFEADHRDDTEEARRLHNKESGQWHFVGTATSAVERAIDAYTRVVRQRSRK
jgi:hypothetical protein